MIISIFCSPFTIKKIRIIDNENCKKKAGKINSSQNTPNKVDFISNGRKTNYAFF